jgi:hypothetical protein
LLKTPAPVLAPNGKTAYAADYNIGTAATIVLPHHGQPPMP